ncbi:EamA-like transporter family protein [Pseudoalteromonas sp. DSM 26666]|uniref:aromatic amino acid DMT transporter YddG n=1 Tax=Pseudoalteromonas sp. DSM 26666 TaxID=1761892 RepID=UPI0008F2B290|nr:aromatic amino acid DMT transporter YddG [Pseudoalteromonas sp. DSM 26666]SFT46614.1 EamA-like transporter family protein [Pseudoalteromonas sp. DSM 26666]
MSFLSKHKYTLYGVFAILLWSSLTAFIRDLSELFSPIDGAALMYSVSAIFLMLVMGVPKLNNYPKRYLVFGGSLFVIYEMCLALSLGFANSRQQALEMAVINYLWPALTILFSIIVNRTKVSVLVYPSILIAFLGVAWCIAGNSGLSVEVLTANISDNPVPYSMAFAAAFIWAVYCSVTVKLSEGKNAISVFFAATAISLWISYGLSNEPSFEFNVYSSFTLLLAGVVIGGGYALWNQAIIGGDLVFLGTLSYFIPVLSTLFASIYLSLSLTNAFWQGVVLVTLGSLMCFMVTRKTKPAQ